jgi:hypothetical protein
VNTPFQGHAESFQSGAEPLLNARASVVNRTHRVVREQALAMQEQRSQRRSLWVPVAISSTLLVLVCYTAWALLDFYDVTPTGVPDASDQLLVLLLWSLPITALLLGYAWLRRTKARGQEGLSR